ncbi:MAG TPA: carboxypeptidase regulatory-like domain-containing protein, partial [Lacipirellulaceae bacterium]|nr:carboxypeptidase regulatory-like domain-containing protein [Lacipirellulaceae bacterium]
MGKNRSWFAGAVISCAIAFSNLAQADLTTGTQWLTSAVHSDGSIAAPNDLSSTIPTTAEGMRTLAVAGTSNPSVLAAGGSYLEAQAFLNTEDLSRLILNRVINGTDPSSYVVTLLLNQDSVSGGFGELPGFTPSVLDTAFALEALAASGNINSAAAAAGIAYLQNTQASNGAWTDHDNAPSVYLTALSLSALSYYNTLSSVGSLTQPAASWLQSSAGSNGLWSEDFLSAESLIALQLALPNRSGLASSLQALQAHQLSDGSWNEDAYTSALALRALALSQGLGQSTGATIQGYVRLAGTSQGISNATVSIPSVAGLSVKTNADGYYVIGGLSKGSYTVSATKSGYGSAAVAVQAATGRTTTAADLLLGASAQSSIVKVHLFDSSTSGIISGAAVALAGPGTYSATTDSSGNAEFDGIAPGTYSATVQASGYPTLQGNFSVNAGQILTLNQPLSKSDASNASVDLSATVVDGSTGNVVAGAIFSLGGALAGTSDSSGHVVIAGVTPGSYSATLGGAGYANSTY